uniref:Ribosomal protein S11 n=1 Tax=Monomastix sp. (strain OKE-1) TaxID=141716 RepID=U5YE07_MONSK|nr:ribosomal protein S11 [Monomastix sp. OKE-1]AGZ90213.1 ribosomal protein S11 [Monomastix sp. OKE-1]
MAAIPYFPKRKKHFEHLSLTQNNHHIVHIQSTLNNTILTLTQPSGNTLFWASAGSAGFKNSRKSTSYAAQAAAEKLAQFCLTKNIKKINVKLKGLGYGKEASLKGLQLNGILIHKIEDVNTIPHNGCRLPKKRRM